MKGVKDLDLKMRWSDNDNMKVVNDMKDLGLKVFWFKRILIRLRCLRLSWTKELIIEFKSEFDEKGRWLDSKFKNLLLSYVLDSVFDNLMVALSNRKLNDSKFDNAIIIWYFANISLASAVMMMILL